MRKTALALALALAPATVLMAPGALAAPGGSGNAGHCSDHTTATKVEDGASPATVTVTDSTTGDPVEVEVTITGTTFEVTPTDATITLDDASWCVKAANKSNAGTGTSGKSASTNKNGKTQDISYVVLYGVTSAPEEPTGAVVGCDETQASGGFGVTTTVHELGTTGPISFLVSWDMLIQKDQMQVFYEGVEIFDTGVVGGTGSHTVEVPAGTSSQVTVVMTGPEAGTVWYYTVHCPTE